MLDFIILIIGLVLLIKSADWLVEGSSSLAASYKISPLVIGLTIVAFGTSFPELVVNTYASYSGNSGIVLGNIIGSNMSNILLILGGAAIIYPLAVGNTTIWREIPFSVLAVLVLLVLSSDQFIGNNSSNMISRADGLILLALFGVFLYYLATLAKKKQLHHSDKIEIYSKQKTTILILAGLIGLFLGGKWVVDGAIGIAQIFGLSERVIGLTVVAIGTSLPELVTSCTAALKKQSDIAIGNVVGSNIFNIFWILSISAIIRPIPVGISTNIDILILLFVSFILFPAMFIGRKNHLTKFEGIVFITAYIAYLIYTVAFSG